MLLEREETSTHSCSLQTCPVVRELLFPSSFMLPFSSLWTDGDSPYTRGHKATKEICNTTSVRRPLLACCTREIGSLPPWATNDCEGWQKILLSLVNNTIPYKTFSYETLKRFRNACHLFQSQCKWRVLWVFLSFIFYGNQATHPDCLALPFTPGPKEAPQRLTASYCQSSKIQQSRQTEHHLTKRQ